MTSPEVPAATDALPAAPCPTPDDDPIYRRIVEAANEGIWVADADGRTTFVNDKLSEMLGYFPVEMAALSRGDVLDEAGKALAAERRERRRRGLSEQGECELIRKDGSRLPVHYSSSPFFEEDGRYAGSVALLRDITQRRQVDVALRLREQQLAEAQRVAHLGSWEWDLTTNDLTWSDETYRLHGLAPQESPVTYEDFIGRVHPDDRDMVNAQVGAALEGGTCGFDHRILRADAEIVWIRARGQVVRDEAGTPLSMRGTGQDVTESKRADAALRRAAARLRLLQVMAVAANEAGSISTALQVAVDEICAHAGWSAGHAYLPVPGLDGALAALPIWHLSDPEGLAPLLAAGGRRVSTAAARGALVSARPRIALDLPGDAGSPLAGVALDLGLQAAFAFPVLVEGEVTAVLEFFSAAQDAPDEALLEIIAQVGSQLARVVERQRACDDLASARDAAMESSRLKSEFLATMSHEIRTPMNGVIGLTELLLGTNLDEKQRLYADGVQSAGDALLEIINDILDFSKIEAGRLELEMVDFDLLAIVEQTADLVAETSRDKRLELLTHCHADLPTRLRGDPARIRQVLLNLASNAVKFTEHGEVVIRARLVGGFAAANDDVVVRFEVTDTGTGILATDQERLFEAFIQGDASTTRRFGGTGLGLAISRQLVAMMGGEIGVDSVPGGGSTFWFTLPLQRQPGPAGALGGPGQHALEGRRVLVVDDSDTCQMILRQQLSAWGMRPDSALDGWAALDRLRAAAAAGQPYDLVVLDLIMPGMDGLELAERISADPALAVARLILLTSAAETGAELSRPAAISARLTKPVRQSTLYDRLVHVLTPTPGRQPAVHDLDAVSTTVSGRVLVVEDNAVNQLVARGMLAHLGYGSDVAGNGLEALEAMASADYAAVLMDCHMPEMDGYAATAEIRRREAGSRHTPIIALTANAVAGDRQKCLDAGMDDYLAKPVKSADLDAIMARWFGAMSAAGDQG